MPMAPADPLFLMWCGVNRITTSGRVADPNQRVSREGALKAVTIDAAYSLKMENQIGSIESGKLANFTILDDNPITCNPLEIKNIKVWGTVVEGVKQPVKINNQTNKVGYLDSFNLDSFGYAAFDHFKRIINCNKKDLIELVFRIFCTISNNY